MYTAKVDEIKTWSKNVEGWFINPTTNDWVKLGDRVKLGDGVKLGDWVKLGDRVKSAILNRLFKTNMKKQFGEKMIVWKWVTPDRESPNFDGGTKLKYAKNAIVKTPKAKQSDQQCAEGLHVLRFGYRPEWVGLCEANHNLICLKCEININDICFAGLPTMDAKLRVKKLKVLD